MPEIPIEQDENGGSSAEGQEGDRDTGTDVRDESTAEYPELEELGKDVARLRDQLLRKAAEFDNYKKRTEAEMVSVIRFANEDLIMKLLPVLDDFERSFKALGLPPDAGSEGAGSTKTDRESPGNGGKKEDAFIGGVRLIYGKFRRILDQLGLRVFESTGKPFDPGLHDALLQVPREDLPHHTVVEEIEKGYMYHEKVIRHARVIVSAHPGELAGAAPGAPSPETNGAE